MKINIDRFGLKDVQVDPNTLFSFPKGVLGFEKCKTFKLFHEDQKQTVYWLQSIEDSTALFPIVAPESINLEYEIVLSDEDCKLLELDKPEDVALVVIVYRNEADGGKIAANTHSPVLLNMKKRIGMQKVLVDINQTLHYKAR